MLSNYIVRLFVLENSFAFMRDQLIVHYLPFFLSGEVVNSEPHQVNARYM